MMKTESNLKDDIATLIFTDNSLVDYVKLVINEVIKNSELKDFESIERIELLNERVYNQKSLIKRKTDALYESNKYYINLEFNYSRGSELNKKNLNYVALLYNRNFQKQQDGKVPELKKTIQLNLDNYDYFGKDEFFYESGLIEKKHHLLQNDYLTIFNINMAYLKKIGYTNIGEEKYSLAKLLYILVCNDKKERDKLCVKDEIMEKVNEKLNSYNDDYDNLFLYDPEEILKQDSYDAGLEKGKSIGELQKQQEIAKDMLNNNEDINKIAMYTKLTILEIQELKNNM